MLLAAALDMSLMLWEKLDALNCPVPPTWHKLTQTDPDLALITRGS